jgi:hypothetical protein
LPSHGISAWGVVAPTQSCQTPATQALMPVWQIPLQVQAPVPESGAHPDRPVGKHACAKLSTTPSQSLSLLSQISDCGPTAPWHTVFFPPAASSTQAVPPGRHSPTLAPQLTDGISSTTPLQLSSNPLHTSGW